jgi:hypothetical protein
MAGRGPAPKEDRSRRNDPERGEWVAAPGSGWQHGDLPKPPAKLTKAARDAWETWLGSWFAAYWTPEDVPGLRQVIRLYDQVERGEFQRASELRLQMDTYGITPKGQQDRRWKRPEQQQDKPEKPAKGRYSHLQVVDGA